MTKEKQSVYLDVQHDSIYGSGGGGLGTSMNILWLQFAFEIAFNIVYDV